MIASLAAAAALFSGRWVWLEIPVIGLISFGSGLVTGYGRWALATSMQILVATVLALGLPPPSLSAEGVLLMHMAVGGVGYIGISLVISRLIAASDR